MLKTTNYFKAIWLCVMANYGKALWFFNLDCDLLNDIAIDN